MAQQKSRFIIAPKQTPCAHRLWGKGKSKVQRGRRYIYTFVMWWKINGKRNENGKKRGKNTEEEEERRRRRRKESLREPHEYLDSSWFPRSHTVYGTGSPVIQRFMPVPVELTSASSLLRCFFSLSPDDRPGSDQEKGRRCERKRNGNSSKSRRPSVK